MVDSHNSTHGKVLRQMMPTRPIPWCGQNPTHSLYPLSTPLSIWRLCSLSVAAIDVWAVVWSGEAPLTFTLLGDHDWSAIHAEVDVLIERSGTAFLATSVTSGGCVGDAGSAGITFAINTNGSYVVANSTALRHVFAQGKVAVMGGMWYRLGMDVGAGGTTVSFDGVALTTVTELTDKTFHGWVALGSSWDYVQFDSLNITHSQQHHRATPAPQPPQHTVAE